jgi:hypothetical protein
MKVRIRVRRAPCRLQDLVAHPLLYRALWGCVGLLAMAIAPMLLVFEGRTGMTPGPTGNELVYVPLPSAPEAETSVPAPEPAEQPVWRPKPVRQFRPPIPGEVSAPRSVALPEAATLGPRFGPLGEMPLPQAQPLPGSIAVKRKRGLWRTEDGTLVPFHDEVEYRSVSTGAKLRLIAVHRVPEGYLLVGESAIDQLDLRMVNAADAARLLALEPAGAGDLPSSAKPARWRLLLR